MKVLLSLFVIGFFVVYSTESYGQITPRGSKRMHIQKKRIKRGVRSGSLTAKETARLARQRRNIKRSLKNAKSDDGVVGIHERRRLHRQLNKSSKNIYKAKHNNKTR